MEDKNENMEGEDMVTSMRKIQADMERTGRAGRKKTSSDISDMVLDKHLPEGERDRKRQVSASDLVTTFNQSPVLG